MKLYFQNRDGESMAVDTDNRCYAFDKTPPTKAEIIHVSQATMTEIMQKCLHDHYAPNWYGN